MNPVMGTTCSGLSASRGPHPELSRQSAAAGLTGTTDSAA